MARIRTVKPELAAHEGLYDLEKETGLPIRFAWCMLFTVADRDGRFPWRPRTLKAQILPHDEVEFSRVLDAWLTRGFIRKYRVGNDWFGWIPTFTRHQVINNRESPSEIPPIEEGVEEEQQVANASATGEARVLDASATREVHAQVEGRKEGKEIRPRVTTVIQPVEPPPGLDPAAWSAWLEYRKGIKDPLQLPSHAAAMRKLAAFGAEQAAVVEQSIGNGWTGLFPLKGNKTKPTGGDNGLPFARFGAA